jgi:hypothetical protein
MRPKSNLDAGRADFRCDLKTEVDFVSRGADFEMRLENRSQLCDAAWSRLLSCD